MKPSHRKIIVILLMLLGGMAFGYFVGKIFMGGANDEPRQPLWTKVLLFTTFPFSVLLVLFWHEMGHVVAGLQADFRFRFLTVGPFMWEKETDHSRLTFRWNKDLNSAGGLALLLPNSEQNLARRFAQLAMGGPLASLLLTVLAGLGFWALPNPEAPAPGLFLLRSSCLFLALTSAAIGVITTIPFHSGGFYSDGARFLRLIRGGEEARLESLLLTLIAKATGGTRPKDLDPALFAEGIALAKAQEAPFEPYFYQYQYYHLIDCGQVEEAEVALDHYAATVDRLPPVMQQSLQLEKAFFYAFFRHDLGAACAARGNFMPSAFFPLSQIALLDAAIAKLQGDPERVQRHTQACLENLDKVMDKGMEKVYREWAGELERDG
jgi:hypothetical protein